MKTYDLKIHGFVVRFDNVGKDVESPLFESLEIQSVDRRILVFERIFRRSVNASDLERILGALLYGELGDEITRLRNSGLRPVVHLHLANALVCGASFVLRWSLVQTLARANRGFQVAFPSDTNALFQMRIPSSVISMFDEFGFTVEL